jgi:hypothetical protein
MVTSFIFLEKESNKKSGILKFEAPCPKFIAFSSVALIDVYMKMFSSYHIAFSDTL